MIKRLVKGKEKPLILTSEEFVAFVGVQKKNFLYRKGFSLSGLIPFWIYLELLSEIRCERLESFIDFLLNYEDEKNDY